eukprot:544893-Hanusia_phi.AAC.2
MQNTSGWMGEGGSFEARVKRNYGRPSGAARSPQADHSYHDSNNPAEKAFLEFSNRASSLFSKIDAKVQAGTETTTTGRWVVKSDSHESNDAVDHASVDHSRDDRTTWNARRPTSVFSTTEETSYRDLDKDIEVLDDNPYDRICTHKQESTDTKQDDADDDVIFIGNCGAESNLRRKIEHVGHDDARQNASEVRGEKEAIRETATPAMSRAPTRSAKGIDKICFQFSQTGKCSRGLQCRFNHDVPDHIKNPERYVCYEVDWTVEEDPRKNGEAAAATFELLRSRKRISEEELQADQVRKEQDTVERQARLESKKAKIMREIKETDIHSEQDTKGTKSKKKNVTSSKLSFMDE